MEALACGEIGLSINDFYNLTQRQFYNILRGYNKKQTELNDKHIDSWSQTRKLIFWIIKMNGDPKFTRTLTEEKIIQLPGDEKQKTLVKNKGRKPRFSREELKETFKELDKTQADNGKKSGVN